MDVKDLMPYLIGAGVIYVIARAIQSRMGVVPLSGVIPVGGSGMSGLEGLGILVPRGSATAAARAAAAQANKMFLEAEKKRKQSGITDVQHPMQVTLISRGGGAPSVVREPKDHIGSLMALGQVATMVPVESFTGGNPPASVATQLKSDLSMLRATVTSMKKLDLIYG